MKDQILLQDNQLLTVTTFHFQGDIREIASYMKSVKSTNVTYRLIITNSDESEEIVVGSYLGYCGGYHWWRNSKRDRLYCTEYNENEDIDSPLQTFRNVVHAFPIVVRKITEWHDPV